MPIATAEQYRLFARRRLAAVLIELVAVLASGVVAILVFAAMGDNGPYPKIAAGVALVSVFFLGQLIRRKCFICPVCGAPLPRGGRNVPPSQFLNGHCNMCGTRFIRQGRANDEQIDT